MWFRQAIVEVERREALNSITRFYQGDQKKDSHKSHVVTRRSSRTRSARSHELV